MRPIQAYERDPRRTELEVVRGFRNRFERIADHGIEVLVVEADSVVSDLFVHVDRLCRGR